MQESLMEKLRYFLKDTIRQTVDFSKTDQSKGVPPPPLEKPFDSNATRIDLVSTEVWKDIGRVDLLSAIENRRSCRRFREEPLTLEELSFLLWATQGIQKQTGEGTAFRTVPSAGCRHALETYLCVLDVEGLEPGFYRYLPVEHQLLFEFQEKKASRKISRASFGQIFVGKGAVTFIWTAIPYRMEWRYSIAAHKVIALDAGHVCQNLYLACEAIGAGTCAIAAYNQELMDQLLRLDGKDEFVIYLAPVGKI
jgi:SagB-type dehydrogenase family enzyme